MPFEFLPIRNSRTFATLDKFEFKFIKLEKKEKIHKDIYLQHFVQPRPRSTREEERNLFIQTGRSPDIES